MGRTEYAESWAWVHLLLETDPSRQELLHNYLIRLRRDAVAEPLSSSLRQAGLDDPQLLLAHVRELAAQAGELNGRTPEAGDVVKMPQRGIVLQIELAELNEMKREKTRIMYVECAADLWSTKDIACAAQAAGFEAVSLFSRISHRHVVA